MLLADEPGILSAMLNRLSELGANILTITQSLPVHKKASVTLSLDVSALREPSSELFSKLEACHGVEQVRLIAVEYGAKRWRTLGETFFQEKGGPRHSIVACSLPVACSFHAAPPVR